MTRRRSPGRRRPRTVRFRWTIPTTLSALWALICFVETVVRRYAPTRQDHEDVVLAAVEAMSNSFNSMRQQPGHRLVVGLTVSARAVTVSVKDPGQGFRHTARSEPLVGSESETGRGLFLIEHLMTRVRWSRRGNGIAMTRVWRPVVPRCRPEIRSVS